MNLLLGVGFDPLTRPKGILPMLPYHYVNRPLMLKVDLASICSLQEN